MLLQCEFPFPFSNPKLHSLPCVIVCTGKHLPGSLQLEVYILKSQAARGLVILDSSALMVTALIQNGCVMETLIAVPMSMMNNTVSTGL